MSRPTNHGAYIRQLTYDLEEARDAMSRGHARTVNAAVDRALAREAPAAEEAPREVVKTALAIGIVPDASAGVVGPTGGGR